MSAVTAIKPNPNNPKQGFVKFEDGTEAWTPDIALLAELVGKELPHGWLLRDGKNGGKQLLPPKEPGKAAFANTAEGMAYVQERTDRRTALMQAVAVSIADDTHDGAVTPIAEKFYDWLRQTSGGAALSLPGHAATKPSGTSPPTSRTDPPAGSPGSTSTPESVGGQGSESQTEAVASGPCPHTDSSPLNPDGSAVPGGRIRCLKCGHTWKDKAA